MARQNINTGSQPNDRTGDKLRVAFGKVNENFGEVYNDVSNTNVRINTVFNATNNVFDVTNAAFNAANTTSLDFVARGIANGAFLRANNAANTANVVAEQLSNVSNISGFIFNSIGLVANTSNAAFNKANNFLVNVPATSKGTTGDSAGMFAANSTYFYYCTTSYVNGVADIWKRIGWSSDTW